MIKSFKWLWLMCLATFTTGAIEFEGVQLEGFSWRKIAGLMALITAIRVTIKHVTPLNYNETLYSWQLVLLICIGLITVPQLIETITSIKTNKTP